MLFPEAWRVRLRSRLQRAELLRGHAVWKRAGNHAEQRLSWSLLPTGTGWRRKRLRQRLPKALGAALQQPPAACGSVDPGTASEGEAHGFLGSFALHHCQVSPPACVFVRAKLLKKKATEQWT